MRREGPPKALSTHEVASINAYPDNVLDFIKGRVGHLQRVLHQRPRLLLGLPLHGQLARQVGVVSLLQLTQLIAVKDHAHHLELIPAMEGERDRETVRNERTRATGRWARRCAYSRSLLFACSSFVTTSWLLSPCTTTE